MLHSYLKAGIFWCGMLLSLSCYGQRDLSRGVRLHEPLGSMPTQYTGAFAGETGSPRLNLYTGYVWRHFPSRERINFYAFALSYDQFIPALRTGIGFSAHRRAGRIEQLSDNQEGYYPSVLDLRDQYYALDIAPKFSIKGKYTLSPFITLNYLKGSNKQNWLDYQLEGFGSRLGILWNTPKYYIGYSFNGIDGYQAPDGRKPQKHFTSYLQAGYTFQKSSDANFSVTPQLVLLITSPYHKYGVGVYAKNKLDQYVEAFNLNFRYKQFIWGVNNAGIHLGFQSERLRLMLTNDSGYFGDGAGGRKGILGGQGATYYEGNLSLRYVFK
ncbi:hypothetical protein [Cesiribacter andamanensis]|uniref:Bacteroidetes-specific membrane protein n=1 Tax=Cesiribacter andamanensis AMV16 TaxID=1279009 RepID=M7NMW2_9BACT|nr:hypothetical protein [Cesiribacter andamanensis]EMR03095.1 hypothetical protein ADICEAN_01754 [Cesiribacter andamanensis AMV16]